LSQVNSEIVRLVYEAVMRHGPDAGVEFADEAVEVVDHTDGAGGSKVGGPALAEVYARPGLVFEQPAQEPIELIDAGDAVVACLRVGGRTVGSGAESWTRAYHVHWLRAGRTVRLEVCGDRASALRAAVTPEPGAHRVPLFPAGPEAAPGN
jgi:hypothetical protein